MNAQPKSAMRLSVGSFLQDVATRITPFDDGADRKVLRLGCTSGGSVLAVAEDGIYAWSEADSRWYRAADVADDKWLVSGEGNSTNDIYIASLQSLCHLSSYNKENSRLGIIRCPWRPPADVIDVVSGDFDAPPDRRGPRFALSAARLYDVANNSSIDLPEGRRGAALALLPSGDLLVGTDRGLVRYRDGRLNPVSSDTDRINAPDRLPDPRITALAADDADGPFRGEGCWVGTRSGLAYLIGASWLALRGSDGLPCTDIRCLHVARNGDLWVGTARGAALLSEGAWRWYTGQRWLRDDEIQSIASDDVGRVWIAGRTAISRIDRVPMNLPAKADHYERLTRSRHVRNGYVAACFLESPGEPETALLEASDNDGLWTALYVAAQCFRWSSTGDPEARNAARESMRALFDLVRVTGIPGFPARALIRPNESVVQSDPGLNWYPSPTMPGVIYKNDTSSDEIDGHYLAWYLYHDQVADLAEQLEIREVCRAVTNHILDNGCTMVGPSGARTSWGVWSPELLNYEPEWVAERGLNSLEILSHLKVAIHLCGDARFVDAYENLIVSHGYAINTVRQKMTPPEAEVNHSDDELAACAYYPLISLEEDPRLRRFYLQSLERTQAVLRREGSPLYNILYGALTGRFCDLDVAVEWLIDAPLDLTDWSIYNGIREDKGLQSVRGRFGETQFDAPPRPSERRVSKWNSNPYAVEAGEGGAREEDGTFWLLPYWMGRYHGLIED